MITKPTDSKHEHGSFPVVKTKTNPNSCLRRANFDHLMDLLDAHPERVKIRRETYEFYYKKIGVEF